MQRARQAVTSVLAVLAASGLAACAGSPPATGTTAPARIVRTGHSAIPSVVLTPLGARRIGIQTVPAAAARRRGSLTIVPYAALLYEPDGRTAVYVATGPLTYTRRYVAVRTITGSSVLVSSGLRPGASVVTVGAEELLGVQNGVGVQT